MTPLIIDYGHGGLIDGVYQTPGGKQYTFTDVMPNLTLYEGVSNRMTAAALMRAALAAGYPVFDCVADQWVRTGLHWSDLQQKDISLTARVNSANQHPDGLLVSCHSNAVGNAISGASQSANGIDIYTSRGTTRSDAVATSVYNSFADNMQGLRMRSGDWQDGDVDHEANFTIIAKTTMPAVLGEVGFFTNLSDARYLHDINNHGQIALCYWYGVRSYLEGGTDV